MSIIYPDAVLGRWSEMLSPLVKSHRFTKSAALPRIGRTNGDQTHKFPRTFRGILNPLSNLLQIRAKSCLFAVGFLSPSESTYSNSISTPGELCRDVLLVSPKRVVPVGCRNNYDIAAHWSRPVLHEGQVDAHASEGGRAEHCFRLLSGCRAAQWPLPGLSADAQGLDICHIRDAPTNKDLPSWLILCTKSIMNSSWRRYS